MDISSWVQLKTKPPAQAGGFIYDAEVDEKNYESAYSVFLEYFMEKIPISEVGFVGLGFHDWIFNEKIRVFCNNLEVYLSEITNDNIDIFFDYLPRLLKDFERIINYYDSTKNSSLSSKEVARVLLIMMEILEKISLIKNEEYVNFLQRATNFLITKFLFLPASGRIKLLDRVLVLINEICIKEKEICLSKNFMMETTCAIESLLKQRTDLDKSEKLALNQFYNFLLKQLLKNRPD